MTSCHYGRRQRGVALITALVVAALTTSAAVAMAARTQLEVARVANQLDQAARRALVARVELGVRDTLRSDALNTRHDAASEMWATPTATLHANDVEARATVRDVQRLFNLNNLARSVQTATTGPRARRELTAARPPDSELALESPGTPSTGLNSAASPKRQTVPDNNSNASADSARSDTAAEPQFIESTRYVFDAATAASVRGRGRPSDFVNIVGNAPKLVAETYIEQIHPEPSLDNTGAVIGPTSASSSGEQLTQPGNAAKAGTNGNIDDVQVEAAGPTHQRSPAYELAVARFSRLLDVLEIDEPILQAIQDWLDPDSDTRFPNGAEDAYYMKQDPTYRSANRPFNDASELLLVRGVTTEIYHKLAPHITALPHQTSVNLNTAPLTVLMSLSPALDRRLAEMIVHARDVQAFRTLDDFRALPMIALAAIDTRGTSVYSEYFESTTTLTSDSAVTHSRAIMTRSRDGETRVIERRVGYFDD